MDVFVSYASTDRDRIAPLVQALEGGGWSVWWDRHLEAGTAFDREIQHALDESKCVIVVWTEASVESDWVLAEAGDGLERGILIPVMLDDVRPPLAFRRTHAVQREDVIEAVARLLTGAKTVKDLCVLSVHFVNLKNFDADLQRVKRIAGMFRGRMNEPEDGSIQIQFPSVVGSTRAALEMRKVMGSAVRLGIHLGEAHVEDGQTTGEAVQIAVGLADLASAGAVCLSDIVFQEVRRRLELAPVDLGEQSLSGVMDPVHAYTVGGAAVPRAVARVARQRELQPQDVPSLVVLPFRNMNGDPNFEYFGDGLAIDIVEELLRIPRLHVISWTSSFTFKQSTASAVDIARELGARHVLEGSVRQAGGQLRITTKLTDTQDGRIEWADHYDHGIDDVFAVQDEITRAIATEMDVKFYLGEGAHTTHQLIRSSEARQQFYMAWELANRFNKTDMEAAKELFEKAIRLEPESPVIYSMLAWAHYLDVERGWSDSKDASIESIKRLVDEALERDDSSGIGPMLKGYLYLIENDHDAALTVSESAVAARPSCPAAFSMRASILSYSGYAGEAIAPAQHAFRLSPVVQPIYPEALSLAYYLNDQLEEALESANETLSYAPDSVNSRVVLAASLVETGREDAAINIGNEILGLDPTFALERYESTHPFREKDVVKRITDSLRQAGLDDRNVKIPSYGFSPSSRRRLVPQRKH